MKLEAKNPKDHCDWPSCENPCCGWGWTEWNSWPPNWSTEEVKPIIQGAFGDEDSGIFTPAELVAWQGATGNSGWPSMAYVRDHGPFVIALFDNQDPTQVIPDPSVYFSPGFDGLSPSLAEIDDCKQFSLAVKAGNSRIRLDGEDGENNYAEAWSNVLMHPPNPQIVDPGNVGYQFGTLLAPFQRIGWAVNASRTPSGELTEGTIVAPAGDYPERMTIKAPLTITAIGGTARIGGSLVAYTATVRLLDVGDAGTSSDVYLLLAGTNGTTSEFLLANPGGGLSSRGCANSFWDMDSDVGSIQSVTVRVAGSDDVAIDDIFIDSAVSGRYQCLLGGWVGDDHQNPATFPCVPQ